MKQGRSVLGSLAKIEGLPVAVVLLILYGVFFRTSPEAFSHVYIYMSFLQTVPPQLVLALGLTFVITAGEIDLSFSSVVAFAGFVFSWFFKEYDAPWVALVLALASGALVGYVNGLLVARIGVPSIMATLAAQFFWSGLTVLLAGGLSWNIKKIEGTPIHTLFVGRLFEVVPAQAIWALGLTVFLWFLLNRHRFGESIMFIGDNANVARVMGVDVEATKIKLFTMNGVLAAFAAVLLTLEMTTFWTTQGEGFLLPVMAMVFMGGTSIAGGEGLLVGTFFGSYIWGSLEAGVVAMGIGGYWTRMTSGFVMAASVVLNILISEGRIAKTVSRIGHWMGARPNNPNGGKGTKNSKTQGG